MKVHEFILSWVLIGMLTEKTNENSDARRLYDDLMSSYNKLIRPVENSNNTVTVKLGLKLTQIIDLNLKNQIMTTNMWVKQRWFDYKLQWDPQEYGGMTEIHVPADQIWLPDLVLYNNADGSYEITIMTKAIIHYDGTVIWNPPAVYKSFCSIDIQYFPFDTQHCHWKFGTWSHGGYAIDLQHLNEVNGSNPAIGIDLTEYYLNVEWDVMHVNALRRSQAYDCCSEPFIDIIFNITVRRKTLFYTVNMIVPCVGISCLSILVFYLPSDSREKVSLSISIMLSLIFFLLVLIEIIPTTSLSMPLFGKYLCFTLTLVVLSVMVTVIVLNIHFRLPSTHRMAPWIRKTFIHTLPKFLLMKPPQYQIETFKNLKAQNKEQVSRNEKSSKIGLNKKNSKLKPFINKIVTPLSSSADFLTIINLDSSPKGSDRRSDKFFSNPPKIIEKTIINAMFIAQHIDNADEFDSIKDDWKYVAMVLDRIFLWIFSAACIIGTVGIFVQAPTLYDQTQPIDVKRSLIAKGYSEQLAPLSTLDI